MSQFNAQQVARSLRKHGAEMVAQKGSHAKYRYYECVATIPMHGGDIKPGTMRAIEKAFEPCFGKGWMK